MVICERQKLLYLAPPKTGSISVVKALTTPEFGGYVFDDRANHHNTVWEDRFQDWFIFITARHPYTKAVSFWRFACNQAMSRRNLSNKRSWPNVFKDGLPNLEGFLVYPKLQYAFMSVWRTSWHLEEIPRPVDKVVYQETFAQDLKDIPSLTNIEVTKENNGPDSRYPWHHFYTPQAIEHVKELWEADFEAFGYNPNFDECVAGQFFTEKNPRFKDFNEGTADVSGATLV
jgi:hypothetical protein